MTSQSQFNKYIYTDSKINSIKACITQKKKEKNIQYMSAYIHEANVPTVTFQFFFPLRNSLNETKIRGNNTRETNLIIKVRSHFL